MCIRDSSRPYVIKVTTYDEDGHGRQVPVDYAATREEANIILARYNDNPWNIDRNRVTLAELYKRWLEVKAPKLGSSRLYTLKAAYKHCQKLYGKKYRQIRAYHMQATMDDCGRSYATQSHIKALWWHLDNFAFELDIIDKMYSQIISVSTEQGLSLIHILISYIIQIITSYCDIWFFSHILTSWLFNFG